MKVLWQIIIFVINFLERFVGREISRQWAVGRRLLTNINSLAVNQWVKVLVIGLSFIPMTSVLFFWGVIRAIFIK